MNPYIRKSIHGTLFGLLLVGATACSSFSTRTLQYVGAPRPPSTSPAQVEILRTEPTKPYEKLGEVVIDASIDPSPKIEKIEDSLRRNAAKLGADAVYLVHDQIHPVGVVVTGPWWSPMVSSVRGRLIVGIAIKYK
ncbi:MAG: hypothetical protein N3G20_10725 [Verrucomicrobiae bacterium]|nr:hypothetical protein [Verrucomicrobiae bacterium]